MLKLTVQTPGQRGQATLVGVLVALVMVFVVAGAVGLGTSSLLGQQRPLSQSFQGDVSAQNAMTAALAQAAGNPKACTGPSGAMLNPVEGFSGARCLMVDHIAQSPTVQPVAWTSVPGGGYCGEVALPAGVSKKTLFWFSARTSSVVVAYVDDLDDKKQQPCGGTKPSCTGNDQRSSGQVVMPCSPQTASPLYLHIRNAVRSPAFVRSAPEDLASSNAVLLVVAPVDARKSVIEEADLWVDDAANSAHANTLRWEAVL